MKTKTMTWVAMLLIVALMTGCGAGANAGGTTTEPATTPATDAPTTAPTEAPTAETTEPAAEETVPAEDVLSEYVSEVYAAQIERYHTALKEGWDESKYFENEMSALACYYYDGNALENVGFGYMDLDNDGQEELFIGAIKGADQDPSIFEIWTVADGEAVMLAQGGTRNHYVLQYVEEDNMYYVVNEATVSAATNGTYYMMLIDGKLEVMQGIVFDASADEENPWFMTYDLDWDVSNDDPIDEDMANAILESNRSHYVAVEYFPYTLCK